MYNPLKNKMNTYLLNNFIKDAVKVLEIQDKEEVYYQSNKLAVVVMDEEVGKRIYDIVKAFCNNKIKIHTANSTFEISKYISNKEDVIEGFYINFTFDENWKTPSKSEKLQELVKFIEGMQKNGYIIDSSKFKKEECNCISGLLSLFSATEGETQTDNAYLIEYIHYVLTNGEELSSSYEEILSKGLCSMEDLPYCLPVIKMCYEYYTTGTFQDDIYMVLQDESLEESFGSHFYKYLLFSKATMDANSNVLKKDNEYTIYTDNVKIYNRVSSEFERFLRAKISTDHSIEQVNGLIIDLNEKIVGYKFDTQDVQNSSSILNQKFENQIEIFSFISNLDKYVEKVARLKNDLNIEEKEINFDIEEAIVCVQKTYLPDAFRVTEINELFNLIACNAKSFKKEIAFVFFKLYKNFLEEHYGVITSEEGYFDILEVRYLNPNLAKEFVNYALGKEVDYNIAEEKLFEFTYSAKSINVSTLNTNLSNCLYDSSFGYDPTVVPITFDYEVESKYGIKMKKLLLKDVTHTLPDGRKLIGFTRKKDISEIKKQIDEFFHSEISSTFGNFEDDHLNIAGISEIIYSKTLNNYGHYDIKGYITTPILGKPLTDDFLLTLSNKEFLKVCAYLLTKFDADNYIPMEYIYMDDDFHFCVNILEEGFYVSNFYCKSRESYILQKIEELKKLKKCNPFMFVDIENATNLSKGALIKKADSLDEYCSKHGIYYNSFDGMCPICLKTMHPISSLNFDENKKIFEDQYAKHYKFDSNYFIKVYKSTSVDMKLVEENIDAIITQPLYKESIIQTAFVPKKKAVDKDKNFVGYLYDAFEFDAETSNSTSKTSINLNDLDCLKNLARVKCLIRLILQVQDITSAGFKFIENPFENVYFVKGMTKQVQILNIDFTSTKGNLQKTKQWTCEYVKKIITLDDSIEINTEGINNLETLLNMLEKAEGCMKKYCHNHNMYYDKRYLFCPKCIEPSKVPNIPKIETTRDDFVRNRTSMTQGGEAEIYEENGRSVVKVFKEKGFDVEFKTSVLARLFAKKDILELIDKQLPKCRYIYPKVVYIDENSGNIFAYKMDKVEGTSLNALRDKKQVRELGFSQKDIFEILITVGEGIEALHKNDIYIGDLNGRNILVDKDKNVYFLDFDGMGIDEIKPEFCTDGYIDPISKKNKNITMKDDWYSFAIQAFYYLTYTHPFNGLYTIKENGKEVHLEITDKMEKRISLLGNHGVEIPVVAVRWDNWMIPKLQSEFLQIFEKEKRTSIVPLLKEQYNILFNHSFEVESKNEEETSIRINPKFIATPASPFEKDVYSLLTPNIAVYKQANLSGFDEIGIVSIKKKSGVWNNLKFPNPSKIQNVMLSDCEKYAFIIYNNSIVVYDLHTNSEIYSDNYILDTNNVIVNGKSIYFMGNYGREKVILKRDFSTGEVVDEKLKLPTSYPTKYFYVNENSKFVIVQHNTENNTDEIYCNETKFAEIIDVSDSYNILYDEISKCYLVMNDKAVGIIINSRNGHYLKVDLSEVIGSDWNVKNISFHKGNIYIPSTDRLYIAGASTNYVDAKIMECLKIMTPNSIVFDINKSGFSVLCNDNLYEIRKG